jgi:hypothetical protein
LERAAENDYLALDAADDDSLSVLQGHSITYRIALGPQAGRKVLTLQTRPPIDIDEMYSGTVGQVAGFNLHAGIAARADQRRKLERLCRYMARLAVSEQRLSLTAQGKVRNELKTPYNDGSVLWSTKERRKTMDPQITCISCMSDGGRPSEVDEQT